jgi:hypothetical protein
MKSIFISAGGKRFLNTIKKTLVIPDLSFIALLLAIASHFHRFHLSTYHGSNILFEYPLTETEPSLSVDPILAIQETPQ